MDQENLQRRLTELEHEFDGLFHVRTIRLDTDEEFCLREREVLATASTFKLCVLCELFRQAREGVVDLDAPITWKPEFLRGGDGVLRAMAPGQQLSVHNMAVLMMIVSDNTATATIVDLVGPQNVTRTAHDLGLRDTDVFDGYPGGPNAAQMTHPVSTPYDLCGLVTRIYRREILTPEDCDEIIRIMRANRCNDMLPRYVPVGEDWGDAEEWIANKTGYGPCRVEVGVVQLKALAFSLAMFFKPNRASPVQFKCLADYPPVLAMAKAAEAVYRCMVS